MTDNEIINILRELDIGTKINVGMECFDGSIIYLYGSYEGELKQHGYYSKNGWSLYSLNKYDLNRLELPCYEFRFKQNRKRKFNILQLGYQVKSVEIIQ